MKRNKELAHEIVKDALKGGYSLPPALMSFCVDAILPHKD